MIEFIYRAVRHVGGKKVRSKIYSGRYSLRRGEKPITVSLDTKDERVARKRLRDLVAEKQREAEGIIAPSGVRSAATLPLVELASEYRSDLMGRDLEAGHVRDTIGRIERMIRESGWTLLRDISPESFIRWRSASIWSAKTKREYQTSINAFLNWLVRTDRLLVNPLARVDRVDIRGKAVRKSRAFSRQEIDALCRVAPANRRLVYLFLLYTGARKNEAASLVWDDVKLGDRPCVLIRAENSKDKDKRAIPLKAELAALLQRELDQLKAMSSTHGLVFSPFPSDDALHADLRRAGIDRKDGLGRVVHFHAFRKTFQTWGAASGVTQRAAQEILGHSDPALTANVYTDVAALAMHDEVAKLPWIDSAQTDAQERVRSTVSEGVLGALTNLITLAQNAVAQVKAGSSPQFSLAARHGFEPLEVDWEAVDTQLTDWLVQRGYAQLNAQERAATSAICVFACLRGEEPAPEAGAKQGDEFAHASQANAGQPISQPFGENSARL